MKIFNNSSGVDIFWYNLLKFLIINYHSKSEFSSEEILTSYLGLVDNILKTKRKRSIQDLDNTIFSDKTLTGSNKISLEFVDRYDFVERIILSFKKSIHYSSFSTMCEENSLSFYYSHKSPEEFLFDSIAYSLNLISQRIKNSTRTLFDFDLRKTTSLYPQDLINSPFKVLQVYISPFGFYSFKKVEELFHKGLLENELKSILSENFEIIDRSAIIDNEDYSDEGNRYNSSLIIGQDLVYRTFWGRRTKDYVNKLISGTFWFNDDVNSPNLTYLSLHPDSALEGEYEYSIPAKNILFYYSELRLEKAQWERDLEDLYEAGYRKDETEEDDEYTDEDYGEEYFEDDEN